MSDHGSEHHDPHLAHHFHSKAQQLASGKLGMWVFLATEILMFGGLFCAYAIYRANNPDVFAFAYEFLDKGLGAFNTVVLLTSSLTMAWAVRAAQRGRKNQLVVLLALTFLGGCGFMVVKFVEYKAKWEHDVFVGTANAYYLDVESGKWYADTGKYVGNWSSPEALSHAEGYRQGKGAAKAAADSDAAPADDHAAGDHAADNAADQATDHGDDPGRLGFAAATGVPGESANVPPAAGAPEGFETTYVAQHGSPTGLASLYRGVGSPEEAGHGVPALTELARIDRSRIHIFFQIYFLMTGLHGLHVLIGMGLIAWIAVRALMGQFGPGYFAPVDLVGLYWHLVDLIWIFLFPLLYLIH